MLEKKGGTAGNSDLCQIFALGTDKWADIARFLKVGGSSSMWTRMYEALKVYFRPVEEMPSHVRSDEHFLPLARIGYVLVVYMSAIYIPHVSVPNLFRDALCDNPL